MQRRTFTAASRTPAAPGAGPAARAGGLASLSQADASRGLKAALETGAANAVRLLGVQDGFLANPKVHIPLPGALQDASLLLKTLGQGRQVQELEVSLNRAAESAVPLAKKLLVNAVRSMSVADAKGILTGGDTAVTEFFARRRARRWPCISCPWCARPPPTWAWQPSTTGWPARPPGFGLYKQEDASIDHYVTRKALDGLYLMIGDEESKIRRDPVGTGSALLQKVFGAIR